MATLYIINGPSGSGKSTTAKALSEGLPLSFLLNVDEQQRQISHYSEYREERWEIRDGVADAIVDTVLGLDRDVIHDKILWQPERLAKLEALARMYDANVVEVILNLPKDVTLRRASERGYNKGGLLTPGRCAEFWDAIQELIPARPNAHILDATLPTEELVKHIRTLA